MRTKKFAKMCLRQVGLDLEIGSEMAFNLELVTPAESSPALEAKARERRGVKFTGAALQCLAINAIFQQIITRVVSLMGDEALGTEDV